MLHKNMNSFLSLLFTFATAVANEEGIQEFVNGNKLFAASTYKEASKNQQNFLISPLSAEIILALTQSGCKGETAQEIRSSLHLPDNNEKIESAVKTILPSLKGNDSYTLHVVNRMYIQQNLNLKEDFRKSAVEIYQADSELVDFAENFKTATTMNNWVEKETNNKIKNLVNPNILSELTKAVLINCLYFKANWSNPFDPFLTKKDAFYTTPKDVVQVDTMHQYNQFFNYHESSELDAKFLEIPFAEEDISMTIVLPNRKDGLVDLESQIEKVFQSQTFEKVFVEVALPKFKIETSLDFKQILQNLGVMKVFNWSEADLSGIAGRKGELAISDILQKSFIDVDEGGVEAAAASLVVISSRIGGRSQFSEPKSFIADHPFIFYIKARNLIIFSGRILAPNE